MGHLVLAVAVTAAARGLALCLLLAGASTATAQSLADLARQARERRQQVDSGKQYTNDDLEPAAVSVAAPAVRPETSEAVLLADSADAETNAGPAEPAEPGDSDDAAPAKARDKRNETYWRNRARTLQTAMQKLQDDIDMLEGRLTDLALAPNSPSATQERRISEASLAKLRRDLQFLSVEAAALAQEARDRKVPSDWLH